MLVPRQYLGAFKCGHREKAKEFVDEEFSRELLARIAISKGKDLKAVEALTFLTRFNNEFHKGIVKKNDPNSLHQTDKLRKDVYTRENARRRDILSRNRAFAISLSDIDDIYPQAYEDFTAQMIESLDNPPE